jgi:hypothetical protein
LQSAIRNKGARPQGYIIIKQIKIVTYDKCKVLARFLYVYRSKRPHLRLAQGNKIEGEGHDEL